MSELSGVLTLAHRDLIKLLRDRTRIIADFSFPLIFIGILGTTLQAGFGAASGINLMQYVFTGVLALCFVPFLVLRFRLLFLLALLFRVVHVRGIAHLCFAQLLARQIHLRMRSRQQL